MAEDESSGAFTVSLPDYAEDESSGGFTIILPSGTEDVVTSTELANSAWLALHDFLTSGTYAISTNNVRAAYNDELISRLGLPMVIVYPPSFSITGISLDSSIKNIPIVFTIEIYHNSSRNVKVLADEIFNNLLTGHTALSRRGLRRQRNDYISTLDYSAWSTASNHRCHRYTLEVNFRYVGS